MFARLLRGPVNWFMDTPETNQEHYDSGKMDSALDAADAPGSYEPTVLDVIVVKAMLNKAIRLPLEIIDTIVDLAEYWPHTSTEIDYTVRPATDRKDARQGAENQFLLRTPPLGFIRSPYSSPLDIENPAPPQPLEEEFESEDFQDLISSRVSTIVRPCRKIVFTTTSHDQAWGGYEDRDGGTYSHSWTWFEAGLERCNKKTEQAGGDTHSPECSPESEGFEMISTGQTDSITSTPPRPSFDLPSLATLKPAVTKDQNPGEYSFHHELLPPDNCTIQRNVAIDKTPKEHRVVWSYTDDIPPPSEEYIDTRVVYQLEYCGRGKATGDGEFVRNLKLGDIVTVWAKARFPGWANYVDRVKVDVYWAV